MLPLRVRKTQPLPAPPITFRDRMESLTQVIRSPGHPTPMDISGRAWLNTFSCAEDQSRVVLDFFFFFKVRHLDCHTVTQASLNVYQCIKLNKYARALRST